MATSGKIVSFQSEAKIITSVTGHFQVAQEGVPQAAAHAPCRGKQQISASMRISWSVFCIPQITGADFINTGAEQHGPRVQQHEWQLLQHAGIFFRAESGEEKHAFHEASVPLESDILVKISNSIP